MENLRDFYSAGLQLSLSLAPTETDVFDFFPRFGDKRSVYTEPRWTFSFALLVGRRRCSTQGSACSNERIEPKKTNITQSQKIRLGFPFAIQICLCWERTNSEQRRRGEFYRPRRRKKEGKKEEKKRKRNKKRERNCRELLCGLIDK